MARVLLPAWLLLLTACAVGPDYLPPDAEVAPFARADADTYAMAAGSEVEFWQQLDDPLLGQLIADALAANRDLRSAAARYERARALYRHARLDRLPTVTASGSAAAVRASAAEMPGASRADRDFELYELGTEASWELDLFGRVRHGVEARRAEAEADAADLSALQLAVVAELASSYLQLRGLQQQLRFARRNAANQESSLELVESRLAAGRGIELDLQRARAQHQRTLARLPALEAEIAVVMHRVAVLAGHEPSALVEALAAPRPMPAVRARVPLGSPGELLRRRPDVHAAERRLAAATAHIGVASADLYPRFTLGAIFGSQATSTSALLARDSETRVVALGIDWSFLDAGRVRARIAAAGAEADARFADYQQVVLLALEETENALARYALAQQRQRHLEQAAAASAMAARLARVRFDGGAADFLQVLDAERTRLEAEDERVRGRTELALALVALYRALAGGWDA